MVAHYVMSVDQGTTSTRCILFDCGGRLVSVTQREHKQYFPKPGWVEHDAAEIWRNLEHLAPEALHRVGVDPRQVAALGIANQRETTVLWDRRTGHPISRAITWQDTRTDTLVAEFAKHPDAAMVAERSGLPLATYFSAPRIRWLLDHTPGLYEQAECGDVLFGTMETWLIWNLTGGPDGDEHAAYALEGSIAVTGSLVQWFRDSLGLISTAPEIETLARSVEDNGGCYIVPAFSGLYAPYWRSEARGVIVGLTSYITKGHLARAVLEATGWQTREVVDAMNADSGLALTALKVDGGMTADNLLMQFVADVLAAPVVRPMVAETVSLGAAYAAGLAVGYWPDLEGLRRNWHRAGQWLPAMDPARRNSEYAHWRQAVELTFGWMRPAPAAAAPGSDLVEGLLADHPRSQQLLPDLP